MFIIICFPLLSTSLYYLSLRYNINNLIKLMEGMIICLDASLLITYANAHSVIPSASSINIVVERGDVEI